MNSIYSYSEFKKLKYNDKFLMIIYITYIFSFNYTDSL